MSRHTSPARLAAVTALMVVAYTPPAFAYIDPTAAGAALQSLYIIMASALMTVAILPQKVAAGFAWVKRKLTGKGPDEPPSPGTGTGTGTGES